ncbi:MAG TPA: hypothetical protein VLT16_04235 [Candidatus Limnocylindrales bacterium]|nr:hypothetical protein [Candidatus Limnocylindrales bacterium]
MKSFSQAQAWNKMVTASVALVATVCFLCATAAVAAESSNDDPTPTPGFTGVSLAVKSSTIPPGGTFQFQLMLTEPKPIGNSSTRPTLPSGSTGISLYDPIGITAGVAIVNNSGIQITATSPKDTFGSNPDSDYPILTIAVPIPATATVGSTFPLSIDTANSFWMDPTGQPYPQEVKGGVLKIGGTMAISDVVPGGGFQPAGTRISIFGMGFTPLSQVDFSGVTLTASDFTFVSPTEMDVVLPQGLRMDGTRVRVRNENGEVTTYFSYLRAHNLGQSTHPLVAQSYPLFSRQQYTSGTLAWTRSGTTFTALALQNPGTTAAEVTVEMMSATNQVLGSFSFPLAAYSKMTRDLQEFFATPPAEATSVHIVSTQSIQLLGLLGDDASGNVAPVLVAAP